jgi:hypothetical protein
VRTVVNYNTGATPRNLCFDKKSLRIITTSHTVLTNYWKNDTVVSRDYNNHFYRSSSFNKSWYIKGGLRSF